MLLINRLLFCFFGIFLSVSASLAARPAIKRICTDGVSVNTISFYFNSDTGAQAVSLVIYGRTDNFSPFKKIDSLRGAMPPLYNHTGAQLYQSGSYYPVFYYLDSAGNMRRDSGAIAWIDITAPGSLAPDSVSYLDDNRIIIGWQPEKSPDLAGYVVYRYENALNFPIASIEGRLTTEYIDSARKGAPVYKLAARDSCGNLGPIGAFQSPVELGISQDSCAKTVSLGWTPYVGWSKRPQKYSVFMRRATDTVYKQLAADLSATTFRVDTLSNYTDYVFFVRAFGVSDTARPGSQIVSSSSARRFFTTRFQDTLPYIYIRSVNVDNNAQAVSLSWQTGAPTRVGTFTIWRSTVSAINGFQPVATVTPSGALIDSFTDRSASDIGNKIYYYRVHATTTCGNPGGMSKVSNSIRLTLENLDGKGARLRWNGYKLFGAGVEGYSIFRLSMTNHDSREVRNLGLQDSAQRTFRDNEDLLPVPVEGICYRIVATELPGNPLAGDMLSRSNIVCYNLPARVTIPNAFRPSSFFNPVFRPVLFNVSPSESYLEIYNRWGERIKNVSIEEGWDGKLAGGEPAPIGIYRYVLYVRGYDRSLSHYRGTFMLME